MTMKSMTLPRLLARTLGSPAASILTPLMMVGCGAATPPVPAFKTTPAAEPTDAAKASTEDSGSETSGSGAAADSKGQSSASSQDGLYLTTQIESLLDSLGKVALDDAEFKVTGLRAGLVDSAQGSVPFVSFSPIEKADFYQVARCAGDAALTLEGQDLEDLISSAQDLGAEIQEQLRHPFWESITAAPGCSLLHDKLTRTAFLDASPGVTSLKYVIRACTLAPTSSTEAPAEVPDQGATFSCSQILSVSNRVAGVLPKVQSQADFVAQKLQGEVDTLKSEIEKASVELAKKTKAYAAEVVACERKSRQENLAAHRKQMLLAVLGFGAKIGAEFLNSAAPNPAEAFKSLWKQRTELAKDARPILDVVKDIFVTEKASLQTCIQPELIGKEAELLLAQIKSKSEILKTLASRLAPDADKVTAK